MPDEEKCRNCHYERERERQRGRRIVLTAQAKNKPATMGSCFKRPEKQAGKAGFQKQLPCSASLM